MTSRAIAVFAKPPLPGQTKSRLAAGTSLAFAAELSAAMLTDLLNEANGVGADTVLFHPPNCDVSDFGGIESLADRIAVQKGLDLGSRMLNCFRRLLETEGLEQVVIIGSDCITHSRVSFADAFAALANHQVVVQPADDGGYVLIGATDPFPQLFNDIAWGTDTVWAETRKRLAGLSATTLPQSFDVDELDDLIRLREFCKHHSRPCTASVLERYPEVF